MRYSTAAALALLVACSSPTEPEVRTETEVVKSCPAPPDLSQLPSGSDHWNHTKAVIGGSEYEASGEGIRNALRDGRQWLVFDAQSVPIRSTIHLDELTTDRFLVFEGPGPHTTNLTREFAGGPLIEGTETYQLTFRGLTLWGSRNRYPDATSPLMRIRSLDRSRFEDMAILESAGPGAVFGDSTVDQGWVSASSWTRVEAERNGGPGLTLIRAADVHLDKMLIQRNGQGKASDTPGILWIGRDGFSGGTLTRSRFEGAGSNGRWGVEFRKADDVTVWGNYLWLSHLKGGSGVHAYGNRLVDSKIRGSIAAECNTST